jgi:hypothetical protein
MNPFVALVFSTTTGLTCDLTINEHREVWRISADVDSYAYTARSENKVIKNYAMMTVENGFPNTLALSFDKRLLDIKMNGNAFLQSPYVAADRTYVGHCEQPIETGDENDIPGSCGTQHLLKLRPVCFGAGDLLRKDRTSLSPQLVELRFQ